MKTAAQTSLTENEQQILLWLLHHPLQCIADVAVGLDLTISTTARSLQKPGTHHFVDLVTPSTNNRDWSHTRGVYRCLVAFHRAAQAQPTHSIIWFETHFRCARRYRMSGIWHNFRPDAVVEYAVKQERGRQRFHFWLEWDSGTMGNKALRAKIETYRFYSRSLEWRRRMNTGVVALLLIIVPHRSQHDRIMRLVREVIGGTTLHVRMTSWELLQEHGPLAKIWTAVLPLPSEQPSRLRRLLDMEVARSTRS